MKKYITTETINLTVEPGSQVIISDKQFEAVKKFLKPIINTKTKDNDPKKLV